MLKAFAVFDSKAAAFGMPVFQDTRGLALRSFADACANSRSPMFAHPEDYSLYEIGTYDPNTGKMVGVVPPEVLVSASSVVAQLKQVVPSVADEEEKKEDAKEEMKDSENAA